MTAYEAELSKLPATYQLALSMDNEQLRRAFSAASDASLIAVGSGGSFTVASLLCSLHERYTGRVSRPSTPLEIVCSPSLASASPVFLISAEGKNPDIVDALERARTRSARSLHILTNRATSPFTERARSFADIGIHTFELEEKDGYLATNSLLMDAVVVARTYSELDGQRGHFPDAMVDLRLATGSIDDWLRGAATFVGQAIERGTVIITFSPLLRAVAADLESKLSEAALLRCQLADLRSLAHGRHLWFAERASECVVIALIEPSLAALWDATAAILPPGIPTLTLNLGGSEPRDLIAGLLAQMRLVGEIGVAAQRDPGRPSVPQFGRDLHYLDLQTAISAPPKKADGWATSKHEVLGATWPFRPRLGSIRRAFDAFVAALEQQSFRAVVFDYDGTICTSQPHDAPPPPEILAHLKRLLEANIVVGIATGRGGSIQERLQDSLPEGLWKGVRVGLYNCGWMASLEAQPSGEAVTSEFLNHVVRIAGRLKSIGVPIERIRATHPHQVSIRLSDGANSERIWFVIGDALRQAGLDTSRVVFSKHSVDVLGDKVSKSHLVADIVQSTGIHPHQILAMGDQGAWPGNDASLLEHRFSLSVDVPSRRLDRGWKLAPAHKRNVDAALWYLDRLQLQDDGTLAFDTGPRGSS